MSRLLDIARMPTTVDGIHESCMRSWHVLRWMLDAMRNEDASARFLADIADELMDAPFVHEQMTRKADDKGLLGGHLSAELMAEVTMHDSEDDHMCPQQEASNVD